MGYAIVIIIVRTRSFGSLTIDNHSSHLCPLLSVHLPQMVVWCSSLLAVVLRVRCLNSVHMVQQTTWDGAVIRYSKEKEHLRKYRQRL
jgi:Na+-translocating ferredoxin:NAD+ oxidoreductase RnfA subunit